MQGFLASALAGRAVCYTGPGVGMLAPLRELLRRHRYTDMGLALVFVQAVDTLVSRQLSASGLLTGRGKDLVVFAERAADAAFLAGLLFVLIAWLLGKERLSRAAFHAYATFATLNLVDDVLALVVTPSNGRGPGLFVLWDVFAIFVMNVVVFSAWYMILDLSLPGGAFLFPKDGGDGEGRRIYLDYLFISFNTSSTFGPTVEPVISRPGKVLMMLQTLISLVIVTVLLARVINL